MVLVLVFLLYVFAAPREASAARDFSLSANVTYEVSKSGETDVSFAGELTNQTSQVYPRFYSIEIGFGDVRNVTASDPDGEITPTIVKTERGNKFAFAFNKKVVGNEQTLPFTFSFTTNDVAKKRGNIWEINIPGLTDENDFSNFALNLVVPRSFGEPTYIKPHTTEQFKDPSTATFSFKKEILQRSGISLAFGTKQVAAFSLSYHLQNRNVFPITTEVAIPPSTSYQDVFIERIKPKPRNVVFDEDGNWLAEYTLSPAQTQEVTVSGKVTLLLTPKRDELLDEEKKRYLQPSLHWDSNSEVIQKRASQLKTPAAIYRYVVETLRYDYSRLTQDKPRLGASAALQNRNSAVCLEFTDLFIALARASGIPAREVDGFAFTDNATERPLSLVKDILHAWPEYYDEELMAWVMVDPTWGNTTGGVDYFTVLDFNHFAFLVKGKDSTYPVPAGGYKVSGGNKQDVRVRFSEDAGALKEDYAVYVKLPRSAFPGLPVRGSLVVSNIGNSLLPPKSLSVHAARLTPREILTVIHKIPPFGHREIPLSFEKAPFLTNGHDTITMVIGEKKVQASVTISPFFVHYVTVGGGIILVGAITIVILIAATRARRVPLSRQRR